MRKKLSIILLSMASVLIFSCGKKDPEPKKGIVYADLKSPWFGRNALDIDKKERISAGTDSQITGALFVYGTDFYYPVIHGYVKNGELHSLPGAYVVSSVFVHKGDVYAAGLRAPWGATYWKNGEMHKLDPDSAEYSMSPAQIIVNDFGVFVGGGYDDPANRWGVAYWANGQLNVLPNNGNTAQFVKMAVDGPMVYLAANSRENNADRGVYWKNTTRYVLPGDAGHPNPGISSIMVHEHEVYATGGSEGPLYWKNLQPVGYSGMSNFPKDICIRGNDIFVLGNFILFPSSGPVYTVTVNKNGKFDTLGSSEALSLALSEQ